MTKTSSFKQLNNFGSAKNPYEIGVKNTQIQRLNAQVLKTLSCIYVLVLDQHSKLSDVQSIPKYRLNYRTQDCSLGQYYTFTESQSTIFHYECVSC